MLSAEMRLLRTGTVGPPYPIVHRTVLRYICTGNETIENVLVRQTTTQLVFLHFTTVQYNKSLHARSIIMIIAEAIIVMYNMYGKGRRDETTVTLLVFLVLQQAL
jgi:hypothetical protein